MQKLEFDRWLSGKGAEQVKKSGATLYRWWTNTCPFCEASLPAVEKLRKKYGTRGLRVVAVYHPKPPRTVPDEEIKRLASRFGYGGVLAVDTDWSVLGDFYLSTGRRRATSASFLVDAEGVIRFVHPGPVFFPSNDPKAELENTDYELLDAAIDRLLLKVERGAKETITSAQ
jgi:thiol-disulfide isomerase/thioredoxin